MQVMENTTGSRTAPERTGADQSQGHSTREAAKRAIVQQVAQGMTAREARLSCLVPMHRTTVYRLLKRVEREGEQAVVEQRHGHPIKLRGDVLTWIIESCQNHETLASSELQRLVADRFDLSVSVSQLNRVRAAHGVSRKTLPREKKAQNGPGDHVGLP